MGKKGGKKKNQGGSSTKSAPSGPSKSAPSGPSNVPPTGSTPTDPPPEVQESENTATPSIKAEKQDEGPKRDGIHLYTVSIKMQNGEMIKLQLSPGDTVMDVRQLLQEASESCFFTCYDLLLHDKKNESAHALEHYNKISDVADISTGDCHLEMVAAPYGDRSIMAHVDCTRELLSRSSLHSSVSSSLAQKKSSISGDPAKLVVTDIDKMSFLVDPSNSPRMLFPPPIQEIRCVESIEISSFNPPPGYRRLLGDLVYLDVVTLEGSKYCITGTEKGFYVNTSTGKVLDPRPRKSVSEATTLVELLQKLSPNFKKAFGEQLKRRASAHPFENVHSLLPPNSWLGIHPVPDHKRDMARMENALPRLFGTEPIGVHRDWNEEVQSCRDMPHSVHDERILRERALNKITTEFVDAAINGAVGVISRSIPPLNPTDPDHLHMYVHNNIFFSYAFDTDIEELFRRRQSDAISGDEQDVNDLATYASANNELKGTKAYLEADVSGLYTLATAIIDYRGHRLVAQSIIPGVMGSNEPDTLLYGSIDHWKTILWEEKFHSKVVEAANHLQLKEHMVVDGSCFAYPWAAPATCKGKVGSDGRHYIFDLARATPRDANYTGPGSIFRILRPELITAFCKNAQKELIKHSSKSEKDAMESALSDSDGQKAKSVEATVEVPDTKSEIKHPTKSVEATVEVPDTESKIKHPAAHAILFNPNVFTEVKLSNDPKDIAPDEELVRLASNFIKEAAIPILINELSSLEVSPVDGQTLTEALHEKGINVRYIGKVAEGARPIPHLWELCSNEIIVRSAKHILKDLLRDTEDRELGHAISHFLNCFFGNVSKKDDASPTDSKIQRKGKMRKGASSSKNQSSYLSITTNSLWTDIRDFANLKYQFVMDTAIRLQAKKIPVLRNLCLKVGIVLAARDYNLTAEEPFKTSDILDLRPLVKHGIPINSKARDMVEQGKVHFAEALLSEALKSFSGAITIFDQVAGPINKEVAECCRHLAMILHHSGDINGAIAQLRKELIINERCLGLDHPDTAHSYCNLAHYYHSAGQTELALRHMDEGLIRLSLCCGPDHPDVPETLINIGIMYQDIGNIGEALRFFQKALEKTKTILGEGHYRTAVCHHALAILYNAMEAYKLAVKNEEHTKDILFELYGKEHPKTQDSENWRFIFTTRLNEADARKARKQAAQQAAQAPPVPTMPTIPEENE